MHVIHAKSAASALAQGLNYLQEHGEPEPSRAGEVLVAPGPVTTLTTEPRNRVLFSRQRDANPFFHLYEALWMLGGRSDAAPLNKYVRDFGERFAEPGGHVHGAYGARWRAAFGFDQLDHAVQTLAREPASRQVVLQMWDATATHTVEQTAVDHVTDQPDDRVILAGLDDARGAWRDRPCNTHAYLRLRPPSRYLGRDNSEEWARPRLDLTVCCRSNDAVWGAHGANAVHFSVLLEYLAARLGAEVGEMWQVSNNYHVYRSELDRLRRRAEKLGDADLNRDLYARSTGEPPVDASPVFDEPDHADEDVAAFLAWHDAGRNPEGAPAYHNWWFAETAEPALLAHRYHREGDARRALDACDKIESRDWHVACREWIERRTSK